MKQKCVSSKSRLQKCLNFRHFLAFFVSVALCAITVTSQLSFAGPGTEARVNREALIVRAFHSVGFILNVAVRDEEFIKTVPRTEYRTLERLVVLAQRANLRDWLMRYQAPHTFDGTNERFEYVMFNDTDTTEVFTAVEGDVKFRDDEAMFRLKPGEPARTAVTSENNLRGPIYVNRSLISKPEFEVSFSSAVALAVHEFGNKLGPGRDQQAVDSIAAKIQKYVQSYTQEIQTPRGKVTLMAFKKIFASEMSQLTFGAPFYKNKKGERDLWLLGDQGLYLFIDDGQKITDLSEELMNSFARGPKVLSTPDSPYKWISLLTFGADSVKWSDTTKGLRLQLNVATYDLKVPFLTPHSPAPSEFRPWKNRPAQLRGENFNHTYNTFDLSLDRHSPAVARIFKTAVLAEEFSVKVEKISSESTGDDHVIIYKLPPKIQPMNSFAFDIQPVLRVSHGDHIVDIWGQIKEGTKDHFVFKIPRPSSGLDARVESLEVLPANVAYMPASGVIYYKLSLAENEVIHFKNPVPFASVASLPPKPLQLKSMQIWDGSAWSSLRKKQGEVKPGSTLRFIFDSAKPLTALSIEQSFITEVITNYSAPPMPPVSFRQTPKVEERFVEIPLSALKQQLIGNKLIVDWNIDDGILLSHSVQLDPVNPQEYMRTMVAHNPAYAQFELPQKVEPTLDIKVTGTERQLGMVKASSEDLQSQVSSLVKNVVVNFQAPAKSAPMLKTRVGESVRTCRDLLGMAAK